MGKRPAGCSLAVVGAIFLAIYFFGFLNWFHTKPSDNSTATSIATLSYVLVIGGILLVIVGLIMFASGGDKSTSVSSASQPKSVSSSGSNYKGVTKDRNVWERPYEGGDSSE